MMVLDEPMAYMKAHPPKVLRHCVGAGEPLNPEVIKVWEEATGMTIRDGYGQTETVLLCANFPPIPVKPGSMGKPSPGFEVSVIDHDGSELPPNKEGDIAVRVKPQRPTWMFKEYWRNPDATNASPELASELQEHVKKVTAPYKYPREIEFVESLPKTISGKIRRVELRERQRARKSEQ
jgi:acyl-coenzyme A synthetase/AMP-(fatty) acid ligase